MVVLKPLLQESVQPRINTSMKTCQKALSSFLSFIFLVVVYYLKKNYNLFVPKAQTSGLSFPYWRFAILSAVYKSLNLYCRTFTYCNYEIPVCVRYIVYDTTFSLTIWQIKTKIYHNYKKYTILFKFLWKSQRPFWSPNSK